VALTANALTRGAADLFKKSGFNGALSKPIDVLRLDAALNRFIRDRQSAETLKKASELGGAQTAAAPAPSPAGDSGGLSIQGVDVPRGIAQYSSPEIFQGILRSYAAHTPGLLEKLRALSPETLGDYTITVHGLKSASYGIFAQSIGERAEELEALSRAGKYDEAASRNAAFIRDTEALISGIRGALPSGDAPAGKPPRDRIPREELAAVFEAARRFKTMELEKAVAALGKFSYTSRADGDLAAWLAEQTENLEYDAICGRLGELL
jgi:HPt (histidine-containing phosphotransfer) domain-containing protein